MKPLLLRYALLLALEPRGSVHTASSLAEVFCARGLPLPGRPAKRVLASDLLRTECNMGRVVRVGWGVYTLGHLPRATRARAVAALAAHANDVLLPSA